MGLINWEESEEKDRDHLVAEQVSTARGTVLRSDRIEATKIFIKAGGGTQPHRHEEEGVLHILEGQLEMTVDGATYVVNAGQASYYPPNVEHSCRALTDIVGINFRNIVDPFYASTGELH